MREIVAWTLQGVSLIMVLVTFVLPLPIWGPSQDYAVGGSEFLFAVRWNHVPPAVVLLGAGVLLALVGAVVHGVRRVGGYVVTVVVLGCAALSFASLPSLDRCWGHTHLNGPFEGEYRCFDVTDDMTPVDLPLPLDDAS